MTKPNRLKVTAVSSRKPIIHSGWSIRSGTNRADVARMIRPIRIDLEAAAPTKPSTTSSGEIGADRIS